MAGITGLLRRTSLAFRVGALSALLLLALIITNVVAVRQMDDNAARVYAATDLFDAATIETMAGHWLNLLHGIVEAPAQRVGQLPLLAAHEQQQMVEDWNTTAVPFADDQCLHQLIEASAARTPTAAALSVAGETLDHATLNRRANRLAWRLRAMGVGPDVLVGIAVDRGMIASEQDRVAQYVQDGGFSHPHNAPITWQMLLNQTSEWQGTLWDKPDMADRRKGYGRRIGAAEIHGRAIGDGSRLAQRQCIAVDREHRRAVRNAGAGNTLPQRDAGHAGHRDGGLVAGGAGAGRGRAINIKRPWVRQGQDVAGDPGDFGALLNSNAGNVLADGQACDQGDEEHAEHGEQVDVAVLDRLAARLSGMTPGGGLGVGGVEAVAQQRVEQRQRVDRRGVRLARGRSQPHAGTSRRCCWRRRRYCSMYSSAAHQ